MRKKSVVATIPDNDTYRLTHFVYSANIRRRTHGRTDASCCCYVHVSATARDQHVYASATDRYACAANRYAGSDAGHDRHAACRRPSG